MERFTAVNSFERFLTHTRHFNKAARIPGNVLELADHLLKPLTQKERHVARRDEPEDKNATKRASNNVEAAPAVDLDNYCATSH